MPTIKKDPPTQKQLEYLEILFNDNLFPRDLRNSWLSIMFHHPITYLTDLYKWEASNVIEILREMKESKK